MGLDVYPAGRPKPGHEAEWERCMEILYAGKEETEEAAERRFAVSIQAWADVGAPRVGYDHDANVWALSEPGRDKNMTDEEVLKDMHGFYVLELMRGKCDGISNYTHAGMYTLDETSFRGSFLQLCEDILGKELLVTAWTDCMPPEEAITYGMELLHAADRATRTHMGAAQIVSNADQTKSSIDRSSVKRTGLIHVVAGATNDGPEAGEREAEITFEEKIDILRSAGRWYVFWGKRGHPIVAWY